MPSELSTGRSIILVDKPKGPTSFDIVESVSRALGVAKAGHAGTLDPNATGLLVIALGEARKAMPVLSGLDKEYTGTMRIHCDADRKVVEESLLSFRGTITQTPPVRSAVARRPRKRRVYDIELIGMDGRNATFRVLCEAGTYIRKIAHDAGEKIGCGAHLTELRRTKVGPFSVDDAAGIDDIEKRRNMEKALMTLEVAISRLGLPSITVKDAYEKLIRNGSPVRREFVVSMNGKAHEDEIVPVFTEDGKIICLSRYAGSSGTIAKTDRVFI
ncbi:MAG: RNA-guided pseudouridylation complex pseudouridine synthase subunit Cbf5 [Candidatus Aenigmarchaeota archaeon]|nr:RNA-guided pseudouridylation complex pseudouridine synthase subunit Cbf5 [Candidatus Aenigmarchaeota archaeon]